MSDRDLFAGVGGEAPALITARLESEPLRVSHAEELAPVLDDVRLHQFIGGHPLSAAELRARYGRQVAGRSGDGCERWFNWVVRENASGSAIGQVQATVTPGPRLQARLAWTIAVAFQGQGYAREVATTMVAWLTEQGVGELTAHIHQEHVASRRVAAALALLPTGERVDGEVRWSSVTSHRAGASDLEVRVGGPNDKSALLDLFDEAIAWLVARDQSGQWGSDPYSSRPFGIQQTDRLTSEGGLRIAGCAGRAVGALVVGSAPAYVTPPSYRELYIQLLLTSRAHAGQEIGARLIERAFNEARERGCEQVRVDCWAGAPGLIAWYERQGFLRSDRFELNGWPGQTFTKAIPTA